LKNSALRISIIIFIFSKIFAQESSLHIDADYAVFYEPGKENIVELSYALYPSEWVYKSDNNGKEMGQVVVQLELFQDNKIIYRTAWKVVNDKKNLSSGNQSKIDILRFKMKKGMYKAFFKVVDSNNIANSDSVDFNFNVPFYKGNKIEISDIMFCTQARKIEKGDSDLFKKGYLYIEPNPGRMYGGSKKSVDFYIEIYGLDTLKNKSAEIYYHVDDDKSEVNKEKYAKKEKIVDLRKMERIDGSIDLKDLFSGTYWLVCQVFDCDNKLIIQNRRKFFLYNPEGNKKEKNVLSARRRKESVGALKLAGDIDEDTEIKSLVYIATKQEKDIIKKLRNSEAKIRFLKEFWEKRDPDLSTVVNEYRKIYLKRVSYSNAKFGHFIDGWQTDRGRVYILYGKPDNIEHHNSNASGRAFQIWRYDNIEGGVEFMFVSFNSTNNFTLVNSTKRGEIKNANWENLIELNAQGNMMQNNQY